MRLLSQNEGVSIRLTGASYAGDQSQEAYSSSGLAYTLNAHRNAAVCPEHEAFMNQASSRIGFSSSIVNMRHKFRFTIRHRLLGPNIR